MLFHSLIFGFDLKTVNLVVGFTPYHALFSEGFINNLEGPVFCYFTKKYPRKSVHWKKISPFGNAVSDVVFYSLRFWFWILRGYKINLYIPHICHFASNFPALSGRCHTVNIYEEGIANYYDAVSSCWDISFLKKVMSFLVALPFKSYSGHITGLDFYSVHSTLSSRPEKLVFKSKLGKLHKVHISVGHNDSKRCPFKVLFLDQPINLERDKKYYLLKHVVELLGDCVTVYYKPHHDSSSTYDFMESLPKHYADMPAEKLVAIEDYSTVISFFSSALINIQAIFEGVGCYYIEAVDHEVKVDGIPMGIYCFLERNGVQSVFDSGLINGS